MKKIKITDYETRLPKINNTFFDKLSDVEKNNYLLLYSLYSDFLYQFLIDKLRLKEYDEILENSELDYFPISISNMDLYQYLSSDFLKYFYIRNNLYIERLDEDEISFLKNKLNNNDFIYDELTKRFIEKTYKKVIFERIDNDIKTVTCYGPDNYNFMKPTNAIVIGVRFDDYHKSDCETDFEWNQNLENKLFQLELLLNAFNDILKEELDISCFVIKYNDFSVNKISDDEIELVI